MNCDQYSSTVLTVCRCLKRETVETVKQVVRTHSATQLKQGVNEIGLGSVRLLLYILFIQQAIQTPTFTVAFLTTAALRDKRRGFGARFVPTKILLRAEVRSRQAGVALRRSQSSQLCSRPTPRHS